MLVDGGSPGFITTIQLESQDWDVAGMYGSFWIGGDVVEVFPNHPGSPLLVNVVAEVEKKYGCVYNSLVGTPVLVRFSVP